MFFIIAFAVLGLLALGLLVGSFRSDQEFRTGLRVGSVVVVFIGLILGIFGSFYTQDPGEARVVKSFTGEVVGTSSDSGLHWTAPWNSTESFDVRNQKLEMFSNDGGSGADGAALSVPLRGGANASVSITVIYSINPGSVEQIYNDFKTQEGLRENALKAKLRDVVRNATASYAPLQVKENRAQLGNDIQVALTEAWSLYGVTIDQVNLGDIALDADTEAAISRVITAQQEVEASRAGLEKSQIAAEVTKTEAQAQADADQIIRCGATSTEGTRLIDGKETKVTIVTPKPNAQCENRLNEQVLYTKYLDTLSEVGAKGNMVVIVPEGGDSSQIINLPQISKSTGDGK